MKLQFEFALKSPDRSIIYIFDHKTHNISYKFRNFKTQINRFNPQFSQPT